MKRKSTSSKFSIVFVLVIVIIIFTVSLLTTSASIKNLRSIYNCDVKVMSLKTNIAISENDEDRYNISGKVLALVEDDLTMEDMEGNEVAFASDAYHFVSQDSHQVFKNDELVVEMVGNITVFGDTYTIYDKEGNHIADAKFNTLNTKGSITGIDGTVWAEYTSLYGFKDYNVYVSEDSSLNDEILLMMMASFYSDRNFDEN